MSIMTKEYMAEYRQKNSELIKSKQKEADKRKREARNADPVALAEYKARRRAEYLRLKPDARTKEEVAAGKRIRRVVPKSDTRLCVDCHEEKPIEQYAKHGRTSRKLYCQSCGIARKAETKRVLQRNYYDRNREKINQLKRDWVNRQPKPVKEVAPPPPPKQKTTLRDDGWRSVFSFGDSHEIVKVYMKGIIIRIMRMPATGQYSTGKTCYSLAFDDSGRRFATLAQAEREALKWA